MHPGDPLSRTLAGKEARSMPGESEGYGAAWSARRRVTLDDVARRAQVSRALVSIVMRDAKGASAATRERVFAAARELGYRPDVRARSLASQRSRLIGVVFGVAGTFHFDMLEGLYVAAEREGYDLLLSALTRRRDEQRAVQSLQDFRFDALVMLGPPSAHPRMAGTLPLVVVGWHVEHEAVDVVRTSDEDGMRLAVEHLVGLGHTRIAHIDGGPQLISEQRRAAYVETMRAAGLAAHVRVVPGGESQLDGLRAAQEMLGAGALPTAVVAYNDDIAVAAMNALTQHGVRVPEDVSLVGWDDSEIARLSQVDLTSVAQDPHRLAALAVERVVSRSEGRVVEHRALVLPPELRVRSSTGPAPVRRR
jgi:DNA-binding LacI/PurR family transcriptional regulator